MGLAQAREDRQVRRWEDYMKHVLELSISQQPVFEKQLAIEGRLTITRLFVADDWSVMPPGIGNALKVAKQG